MICCLFLDLFSEVFLLRNVKYVFSPAPPVSGPRGVSPWMFFFYKWVKYVNPSDVKSEHNRNRNKISWYEICCQAYQDLPIVPVAVSSELLTAAVLYIHLCPDDVKCPDTFHSIFWYLRAATNQKKCNLLPPSVLSPNSDGELENWIFKVFWLSRFVIFSLLPSSMWSPSNQVRALPGEWQVYVCTVDNDWPSSLV